MVHDKITIFLKKYIIHDKRRLRGACHCYTIPGKITLYMITLGCVVRDTTIILLAKLHYT